MIHHLNSYLVNEFVRSTNCIRIISHKWSSRTHLSTNFRDIKVRSFVRWFFLELLVSATKSSVVWCDISISCMCNFVVSLRPRMD